MLEGLPAKPYMARARICKRLWNPGINSEESSPQAYVSWRASTKNRVVVLARQAGNRFLSSIKGLQIRASSYLTALHIDVVIRMESLNKFFPSPCCGTEISSDLARTIGEHELAGMEDLPVRGFYVSTLIGIIDVCFQIVILKLCPLSPPHHTIEKAKD
jgi:hypothetical protein